MHDPTASGSADPPDVVIADPAAEPVAIAPPMPPVPPQAELTSAELMDEANQGMWPDGLSPGSGIKEIQTWLKNHDSPIYGTKAVLWKRIILHEYELRKDQYVQKELRRQIDAREQENPDRAPVQLPIPQAPSKEE